MCHHCVAEAEVRGRQPVADPDPAPSNDSSRDSDLSLSDLDTDEEVKLTNKVFQIMQTSIVADGG